MAPCFGGSAVASESVPIQQTIKFGEDFEFDPNSYELRRSGRVLKLERIPTEILLCLVEQRTTRHPRADRRKNLGQGRFPRYRQQH